MTPFVMNTSQLSEDDSNDGFYKDCMNLSKFYKMSLKELKDAKHEKKSLVAKMY
jgi:hypothetical protein